MVQKYMKAIQLYDLFREMANFKLKGSMRAVNLRTTSLRIHWQRLGLNSNQDIFGSN